MGKTTGGSSDPTQTVNYISVHDNLTIYDKLPVVVADLFGAEQLKKASRSSRSTKSF